MSPEVKRRADEEAWSRFLARYGERLQGEDLVARRGRMDAANPTFVLKNWIAQDAIEVRDMALRHRSDNLKEFVILLIGQDECDVTFSHNWPSSSRIGSPKMRSR